MRHMGEPLTCLTRTYAYVHATRLKHHDASNPFAPGGTHNDVTTISRPMQQWGVVGPRTVTFQKKTGGRRKKDVAEILMQLDAAYTSHDVIDLGNLECWSFARERKQKIA